jgi:hypothetical protein
MIGCITEVTFYFNLFSFINHLLNFLLSNTDDCFFNSLFRTVTVELSALYP